MIGARVELARAGKHLVATLVLDQQHSIPDQAYSSNMKLLQRIMSAASTGVCQPRNVLRNTKPM